MNRSIEVKVVSETSKSVTIKMIAINRKMPVPKAEFQKRVEKGIYKIID